MTTLRPPAPIRWWTLAVVCIATFMLMLDLSIVAIALPGIQRSLHADFGQLQWVFDAYALTLAVVLVTAGSIADRNGRKRVFVIGLAIFTLASLACGVSGTIDVLNVSRGVQGVGAAILFAVGPALIGHEFHGKQRAAAFGAYGASAGLAVASGPLVGGALTDGPGWRWIFFINVPVGLLSVAIAALQLRESRRRAAHRPDYAGMITFTISMAALVLVIIRGNANGWLSSTSIILYTVSGVFLLAFLVIERALGARAMFDLGMFRNVTFVGLAVVTFIANGAGLPSVFIETNFMQNLLHYSPWEAGLRFLPLTLAMFAFGAITGGLIGKVPFRVLMALACTALGVGLALTRLAGDQSSWTALIPSLIATGIGMGMFGPTRAALAIGVAEPARAGVASGVNETFQQVGMALGIAAVGAFFERQVSDRFVASAAGQQLGEKAHAAASAISAGSLNSTAKDAGGLHDQVLSAARDSFTVGFHDAMTLCAVLALAAAVVAITTLRTKGLHPSALTGIPPELPEPAADTRVRDMVGAPVS